MAALSRYSAAPAGHRTVPPRRFVETLDGISRRRLGQRESIGSATVEPWLHDFLRLRAAERRSNPCPQVLGIDEHFCTRRHAYATTFCDLRNHSVLDVVLGHSEASLQGYLAHRAGKDRVRVVCRDMASAYRAHRAQTFSLARIVADRFRVNRLINADRRRPDPNCGQVGGLEARWRTMFNLRRQ